MTGRRRALLTVAVLLSAVGCGDRGPAREQAASSTAAGTPSTSPEPPPPPPSCAARTLAGLDPAARAGQLLMVGVPADDPGGGLAGTAGVPVGGVFLHGRSRADAATLGAAVAGLQASSAVPLQVAVDQEGGLVQTLQGPGFDELPTATEQGARPPEEVRSTVTALARQLRAAGVTLDLAPVADVVPAGTEAANPPIGASDRQYGSDPTRVADVVGTVVQALQDGGVAATAKHFPGLGRVTVNTDTDLGAADPRTTADDPALLPFAAAVDAGTAAVMVSSATYPQLDPDAPAVFSPAVVGLLRDRLGFDGVVMSDDLGRAVAVSQVPVERRAVDAVAAGVDVVLTVRTADAQPMAQALTDRAAADPAFAARVTESAGRVLALKERFGLLTC
ncbi:glycoside hydrolase family 3 N-terminal domain-containing protein [Modestobacter marinus]|uniref:glycoside hydrolase family 3 N-terminal domain-containing protein n=1 Tax=Modestobacter marinus TaxID=477641 RepID=UPI001C953E61|nr:glycoside hydrolase family 3 N-terminal domain-containing protein [Modestobacter marinus]